MSRHAWLILLLATSPAIAAAEPAPDRTACEVWQHELAFARSVQRHDAAAFAKFLDGDSVFDANTDKPVRGVDAIRRHWGAILAGQAVRLDWYPQRVVTTADRALAQSSGVYLFENAAANAKTRYAIGHFSTTWRRGPDQVWRVAFDDGDGGRPASAADVAAFRANRREACPLVTASTLPTIRH